MTSQLPSIALSLLLIAGQAGQDIQTLDPNKSVEREIASGQTHTYRVALQAGQFLRVLAEQKRGFNNEVQQVMS